MMIVVGVGKSKQKIRRRASKMERSDKNEGWKS